MHKLVEAVPQYAKLMEDAYRFFWENPETATVDSARVQANMLVKLLENDGARVAEIKKNFKPTFPGMEAFFKCIDDITMDQKAVSYNEDGTVTLKYTK